MMAKTWFRINCTKCHHLLPPECLTKTYGSISHAAGMAEYLHIIHLWQDQYYKSETLDTAGYHLDELAVNCGLLRKVAPDTLTPA